MRKIINILSNLPFRKFQVRLLLYLLLVGSISLVCAMFVFYSQSTNYARNELLNNANQIHDQVLQRLEGELVNLDHISMNMNTDYLVQRYIESKGQLLLEDDSSFKEHMDFLIFQQKRNYKYVTDICISFNETRTSICSDSKVNADSRYYPVNKEDKGYELYIGERNLKHGIRFISPIYDLNSSVVKGQVAVVMNIGKLLSDLNSDHFIYRHTILTDQGEVIYRSDALADVSSMIEPTNKLQLYIDKRTGNMISHNKVDLKEVNWFSQIEVKNQFLTSTWRSLRNTLVIFFAILFTISIISSFFFSSYVTRPLLNLRVLFKRAELGDLKAYWTSNSAQEINDLGEGYNQMLNRVGELIKQVKVEEALKKDAEIKALQYQLNPHFIYNTLNTIKWVAKIHKTPQISDVVSALVRLLQASLGKKGEFITIKEEIGLIKDYMEIQNFRYGEMVKLEFDIDPIASICLVPRMIMQPLVENALIHGIDPTSKDGSIMIKAWIDRDLLMCSVEDNGRGMSEEKLTNEEELKKAGIKEKMSGIGLRHIREKIKLYYGSDYKMFIFSKENQGTNIRLSLPIHQNEE